MGEQTFYRGTIRTLAGHPLSGLWQLVFESGHVVHVESGVGVRVLAAAFDATMGAGDLLEKIAGQEIIYCVDELGVLDGFTPVDEWTGPEVPDGIESRLEGVTVDVDTRELIEKE